MLTRIEIDGFKSFRRFALDLGPLRVVVGPNSAGKSNLFDALQLLSRLAEMDVYSALKKGRGRVRDQFTRQRDGSGTKITLAAEFLLPDLEGANRLRYEVTLGRKEQASGVEALNIVHEELLVLGRQEDAKLANMNPALHQLARYEQSGLVYSTGWSVGIGPADSKDESQTEPCARFYGHTFVPLMDGQTVLYASPNDPFVDALRAEFANWRFLHVAASSLRGPSERAAGPMLAPDGSNLPTVLAAMPPETFAQVQAEFTGLVPGARGLDVVAVEDEFHVEVEFNDGLRMPARVLSDGTLRILAFLVLLRTAPKGALVAIEEPENGIHPARLRLFLDKLRAASTADRSLQLLLNSHSPTVLAALRDEPSCLLFADLIRAEDGLRRTRIRAVSTTQPSDHGATQVSLREIDRLLKTAQPEGQE